jgi:Leucine-rich repeat (LRR) protein
MYLLDISSNLNLLTFKCNFNNLKQLDVKLNTSLLYFECYENKLESLDISQNKFLIELWCNHNQLISLDVQGIDMYVLVCDNNQLTIIDNLSDNVSLKHLSCSDNDIVSLPVSAHPQLDWISCSNNRLSELDISNQSGLNHFFCWGNPNLNCINVSDTATANTSWTVFNGQTGNIDPQHYFSINCPPPSAIEEYNTSKELIKIMDVLGRETQETKNTLLFYIYNDGSVEQKVIIK